MTIGELFVKITADPSGVKRGTDKAAQELTRFEGVVTRVGGALAAAFTAKKIFDFARDSVREFVAAEAIWARLASTVDATGVSFDSVSAQIEGAATSMQNATRFGDEEFAVSLQNLVIQSGDVQKSLGLMGLAADLAAARGLSLESATETLGRALAGNTTQLTRMFPALRGSKDLFADLQRVVKGMAEQDAATLEGRLQQLTNEWGNFKEALGGALTGTDDMSGAVVKLTGFVQDLTKFVDENRAAIELLISPLTIAAASFQFFVGGGIKGLQLLIDKWKEWRGLTEAVAPAAKAQLVTLPPVVTAGPIKEGAAAVAKVWTDLAAAMKTVATVSSLVGNANAKLQDRMAEAASAAQTQIALQRSALEDLVKLGVDPASKAVQDLVASINLLKSQKIIAELPGFDVAAITPFFAQIKNAMKALENDWKNLFSGGGIRPDGSSSQRDVIDQLAGAFQSLTASLGPMAIVGEFLNGVFAALAPVLDALMVPIRNIGFLVGSVIAPLLKLLQPVLDAVAKAFSFVIQGIGEFLKGLAKAINFLLPGNPANGLKSFGQNMIDMAKETRRAIDAGTDMTKTMEKITASASNMPAIFDLIARRRDAGSDFLPPAPGRTAQRREGLTVVVNNPPAGVDVSFLTRQIMRAITDAKRRGGVTEFDVAVAGG